MKQKMQQKFRWIFLMLIGLVLGGCGTVSSNSVRYSGGIFGKGGGYYLNDGPGITPPKDLVNRPDAVPRLEPYRISSNKPYAVMGKTYYPIINDKPFEQTGMGSWYGTRYNNKPTASGEIYDMYQMTAAHPIFPIPSYARVTNLSNGKQIIVRINDRGPFLSDRIIDLSYVAALKLDYVRHGTSLLKVERILPEEIRRMNGGRNSVMKIAQIDGTFENNQPPLEVAYMLKNDAFPEKASFLHAAAEPKKTYYLQLGAYAQDSNAQNARAVLTKSWDKDLPKLEVDYGDNFYRLKAGPFQSREDAQAVALRMQNSHPAIVIQQ